MTDNHTMSDSLRDRIAAAIAKADQEWCSDDPLYLDMADAVIAALGLREERSLDGQTVSDYGFVQGGMKRKWVEPTPFHRYVTEWVPDD